MPGTGNRKKVAVLFGGRSAEHEVSIVSARGVMSALDTTRFQAAPIGITRQGTWLTPAQTEQALDSIQSERIRALEEPLGHGILHRTQALTALKRVDIVFPLVHGTNGEDGTLQGFLELVGVPYVGAGVTASAVGMDKALQKSIFRQNGLPVAYDIVALHSRWRREPSAVVREIEAALPYPCFVKPANGGSSIGTAKVVSRADLMEALAQAFRHDRKVLIEEMIQGRQVETAILGNDDPEASPVGEITFDADFYDYHAKYQDARTRLHIPAAIPQGVASHLRELGLAAFKAIDCAGLARVDFFLRENNDLIIQEINTLPGFTPMSMYPKLWEHAGVPYPELITRLLDLAVERYEEKRRAI